MADKSLDVYLNDHLAGAMFGSDLAEQLAQRTSDAPFGEAMRALATEIEADRDTLKQLMDQLGTSRNPAKQATTWIAEKLSRVKFSGAGGGDEFGMFQALETLSLGVEGKAALWTALGDVGDRYPPLAAVDFDALHERARDQRRIIEDQRSAAARRAFTGPDAG
ncbi:MAG: hypothetical protein ACR2NR_04390 [Solirubrobacteraceae bacterium]